MYVLLLLLTLLSPPLVVDEAVVLRNLQPLPDNKLYLKYSIWNLLCFELRDIDCTGVKVPKVMTFSPILSRPGLLGYYKGGDTIYVRNNLKRTALSEVLAHEMSHYWDVERLGMRVPGPAKDICFSEKRAWAVSDAYNKTYGNPRDIVGKRWVNWYKHCQPYRNILYPGRLFPE